MTPPPTVKQRIEAARALRGLSQADLDKLGAAEGLGRYELGRVERGELSPMTNTQRTMLCKILGVPERWFTSDDVDEIVGLRDDRQVRHSDLLHSGRCIPSIASRWRPSRPATVHTRSSRR